MTDRLIEIWQVQERQQAELGLDPRHMSDVERRRTTSDLVLLLHEEAAELGRIASTHKRHLLASPEINPDNVTEEIVDILKVTLALAQLHGISVHDLVKGFHRKTRVVQSRADNERNSLRKDTKLICVDLDDVVSDLASWAAKLAVERGDAPAGLHIWAMLEAHKDEFYKQGRFRDMPPVEGATDGMRELKRRGYTLAIITARPQWQYKRLYADTLEWLDNHQVPHDHILFNKDKVEAVFTHLSPAWPLAFIEDHERNAKALAEAGIPVILFDRPHNQSITPGTLGITRAVGWEHVLRLLPGRVE